MRELLPSDWERYVFYAKRIRCAGALRLPINLPPTFGHVLEASLSWTFLPCLIPITCTTLRLRMDTLSFGAVRAFRLLTHRALICLELSEAQGNGQLQDDDPLVPLSRSLLHHLQLQAIPLTRLTLHFSASSSVSIETAGLLRSTPSIRFLALGSAHRSQSILDAIARMPHLEELHLEHWSRRREPGWSAFSTTSGGFPSLRVLAAQWDIIQLIMTSVPQSHPFELIIIREAFYLDLVTGLLSLGDRNKPTETSHPPLPVDVHIHRYECTCVNLPPTLATPRLSTMTSRLSRVRIHAVSRLEVPSDSLILRLASGLPGLQELRWESNWRPEATIVSLGILSRYCNGIRALGIPINTTVVFPSDPTFAPLFHLEALDVTNWDVDRSDNQAARRLRLALAGIAPPVARSLNWILLPRSPHHDLEYWLETINEVWMLLCARCDGPVTQGS